MFKDRIQAGMELAAKLEKYKDDPGIILAVPRGGIPIAYSVAKELNFPVALILTKKIGHPANKEYAIGAASLSDYFVIPHENVSEEYIEEEVERIRSGLKEMYNKFMDETGPESFKGKTVIVTDDGIATGNTLLATIQVLRKSNPGKIIIAAPVASKSAVKKLSKEVDKVVAVLIPTQFTGVGAFYENFKQVTNEEVMFFMNKIRELKQVG